MMANFYSRGDDFWRSLEQNNLIYDTKYFTEFPMSPTHIMTTDFKHWLQFNLVSNARNIEQDSTPIHSTNRDDQEETEKWKAHFNKQKVHIFSSCSWSNSRNFWAKHFFIIQLNIVMTKDVGYIKLKKLLGKTWWDKSCSFTNLGLDSVLPHGKILLTLLFPLGLQGELKNTNTTSQQTRRSKNDE
jgi:hypothetical protein